jgi:YgiT-type zinc finger domain-containing protein
MDTQETKREWQGLGEDIISGMLEWRLTHPKATFREIEAEVDERLAIMRARMLRDAALSSASAEWGDGEEAVCPKCGEKLVKKGKKKRSLQTRGGQEIEIEREYGECPKCGEGIFPPG